MKISRSSKEIFAKHYRKKLFKIKREKIQKYTIEYRENTFHWHSPYSHAFCM